METEVDAPATTRNLSDLAVVRGDGLTPTRWTPHATEPGYLRWITSYVGGRPGYINNNPETGLISDRTITGLMWLPAGNRQFGVHIHTVTEIYVILRGHVESIEPKGRRHTAGPMDCLYIPKGAPHAVRAVGDEDVLLLWVHDGLELPSAVRYFEHEDDAPEENAPPVQLIRWDALEPRWTMPGARVGGSLRRAVSWVGGAPGLVNFNREVGTTSDRLAMGATIVLPGNSQPVHTHTVPEHVLVLRGRAELTGYPQEATLKPLDFLLAPPGIPHGLRAVGDEPLYLLWIHEENEPDDTLSPRSDRGSDSEMEHKQ